VWCACVCGVYVSVCMVCVWCACVSYVSVCVYVCGVCCVWCVCGVRVCGVYVSVCVCVCASVICPTMKLMTECAKYHT
jgi:hypothetical protein